MDVSFSNTNEEKQITIFSCFHFRLKGSLWLYLVVIVIAIFLENKHLIYRSFPKRKYLRNDKQIQNKHNRHFDKLFFNH